jgi:hypothetical protein
MSAGRTAKELSGGRIGSFPQSTSSNMVPHAHVSPGGRSSEALSHPIDMIIINIKDEGDAICNSVVSYLSYVTDIHNL